MTGTDSIRGDLALLRGDGRSRDALLVHDELTGEFARTTGRTWRALVDGKADDATRAVARQAGWMRRRTGRRRSVWPMNVLSFRVPLGSLDGIATRLLPVSAAFFSPHAILFWVLVMIAASILLGSRHEALWADITRLPETVSSFSPILLAIIFVATKTLHELGHAVTCKRTGARVGRAGIWFLCGVPCPYVDLNETWRLPDRSARMATMAAGIYVEWILAALAGMFWIASDDTGIRHVAIHVIVLCGVSSFLFNANPLMRYDGYHMLSDLVGVANLRQRAGQVHQLLWIAILARDVKRRARRIRRCLALSLYHVIATVYRVAITVAIAGLVLALATRVGLFAPACLSVMVIIVASGFGLIGKIREFLRGGSGWNAVSAARRGCLVGAGTLLAGLLVLVPLPRSCGVTGQVDSADAIPIYAPEGVLAEFAFSWGDRVRTGERIARIEAPDRVIDQIRRRGNLRLASIRENRQVRAGLADHGPADYWRSFTAARVAAEEDLALADRNVGRLSPTSPVDGWVLPPTGDADDPVPLRANPADTAGQAVHAQVPICRVAATTAIVARLQVPGAVHDEIRLGQRVRVALPDGNVVTSRVRAVSALGETRMVADGQRSGCEIEIPIGDRGPNGLVESVGWECHGRIELSERSLLQHACGWFSRAVSSRVIR